MVYTASSLALAALEMLVHLPHSMRRAGGFPRFTAVCLEVPDALISPLNVASLPANYGLPDCRALGDAWITDGAGLGLAVPSRVILREVNVVLNPAHIDMTKAVIVLQEDFHFDDRLGV